MAIAFLFYAIRETVTTSPVRSTPPRLLINQGAILEMRELEECSLVAKQFEAKVLKLDPMRSTKTNT